MSCTLATLAACFSLSGFYVQGGIQLANHGEGRFWTQSTQPDDSRPWYTKDFQTFHVFDQSPQNPYGVAVLGYDVRWSPKWQTSIELTHVSSIATNKDSGVETLTLSLTYRPFGR